MRTPTTERRPRRIARWSFWELQLAWTPERTRHLVGLVVAQQVGRVSSAIASIDANSRTVTTETGRTFVLEGPPGVDPDAAYVLSMLRRLGAVAAERNVTTDLLTELARAEGRKP